MLNTPEFIQMLRLPMVCKRTGLSRSQIYRLEAEGSFPKHIKLSERASAWLAHEIDGWIAERIAKSRKVAV